ncbi:hypothetical protein HU200_008160 [Digitaria exilis]|uniref:Inosine/uridine-preferring nucleoside hydrolase domain-containing protein n=1 Tax=Digitaria exilis TaxID=1010633 RepID=A0A835FNN7_9POAL|nr:hypothetical protein HU200_008160 [Digitaria exilis]
MAMKMCPLWTRTVTAVLVAVSIGGAAAAAAPGPQRILVDTDMDTDDLFALLYLLKQNRSEFDVKVRTLAA